MKSSNQTFIFNTLRRAIKECVENASPATDLPTDPEEIFFSPEAEFIKQEIVRAGKKLWARQYVDGNGGNISFRISPDYVICTPTMVSKGDLTQGDLSLVDFNNRMLCGDVRQTSEILLHLEIYKAAPQAKAVIHCHPPYATAHAVAGVIPQGNLIPEQEVFVGPVALSPYDSPGTQAFAETILPYIHNHNTILLQNHGVVCWADTVDHAEWTVEVIETYCKIVMLANQLRPKLQEIPLEKIPHLLAMKKRLGIPDPRHDEMATENNSREEPSGAAAARSSRPGASKLEDIPASTLQPDEINDLASRLTECFQEFLADKKCGSR